MDYNLFPVFIEIMRHRNISRASTVLGLTQSATSNALSRLRYQLGDQLFIRTSKGVLPTEFALEIFDRIEHSVENLKKIGTSENRRVIELSEISRRFRIVTIDYSFLPSDPNLDLKRLTTEQVKSYNREGYLTPLDALSEGEAIEHRAYFETLLNMWFDTGGKDGYGLNCVHDRCQGLYEIIHHPVITDIVSDLLGEDFVCWASHYFSKAPHDPKEVAWHQDASYWKLTPARTVTVWLAVDDVDEENAAMKFIPRTHTLGRLEWHKAGKNAVLDQEITDATSYGAPISNNLKAGQMSVHADMLAHGSEPNRSDRRRCGLTIRYCPTSVQPLHEDWGIQTIQIKGNKANHWKYVIKPQGDQLDAGTYVDKHIGSN